LLSSLVWQPVRVNDPHWVEYVAAFGGLAGVALALVAAWFAWKSGSAAERTAAAAEEESRVSRELLSMQRHEHAAFMEDRARVPRLEVSARSVGTVDLGAGGHRALVVLQWDNTGTKAVTRVGVNLSVPVDVKLWRSDSSGEVSELPGKWLLPAPGDILNTGLGSHYLARTVEAPLGVSMLMHIALDVPAAGRYPAALKFFHHELVPTWRACLLLTVPDEGDATLAPLDPDELPLDR
jgi:hypothetical protein